MIDLTYVKENPEEVKTMLTRRGKDVDIDALIDLDTKRLTVLAQVEELRAERNTLTKDDRERGKELKKQLKELEAQQKELTAQVQALHEHVPNLLHPDVPDGKDEAENVVIRSWGEPTKFDFEAKDHMALGELLDVIDTETAAKVTGSRFGYIKNELALMEYALVLHVMRLLTDQKMVAELAASVSAEVSDRPFVPVVPPVMIRPDVYRRTGRLSDADEDEKYHLPKDDLYLIGSAEHTLAPYHMDQILEEKQLPLRYVGFSTAFRREAGSYGQDVRGILRVHQFDKIELESFAVAEEAEGEQDLFVAIQERLMQDLEIPYQVVMICTGDMGGPDYRQIDINAWLPGQQKYRETHTADLMNDYQARRLNTRVRREDGSKEYAHMNDATALAIGRILIAIVENYQQEDGSVRVPTILQEYVGTEVITPRR